MLARSSAQIVGSAVGLNYSYQRNPPDMSTLSTVAGEPEDASSHEVKLDAELVVDIVIAEFSGLRWFRHWLNRMDPDRLWEIRRDIYEAFVSVAEAQQAREMHRHSIADDCGQCGGAGTIHGGRACEVCTTLPAVLYPT